MIPLEQESRHSVIYSQNFVVNALLVADLIRKSSITKKDVVYEVGPGTGIITVGLAKQSKKVIAVEVDKKLARKLKARFKHFSNVRICHGDFLLYPLPKGRYKVFANMPFNITAEIVRKLVETDNPPEGAFLFIQDEAAKKFAGEPAVKETQFSLPIKPIFELSVIHRFKRTDFKQVPGVEIVLLRIKKRPSPLIELKNIQLHRDFIVFSYNLQKPTLKQGLRKIFTNYQFSRLARDLNFSLSAKPTDLSLSQWLSLFSFFVKGTDVCKKQSISGSENKLKIQQAKLQKIHRTRLFKN
jgi:23S rRNA (adenine-N6)-dimethyltransferase